MFGAYSQRLEEIYDDYYNRLARVGLSEAVMPTILEAERSSLFTFAPEATSQLDNIFTDFIQKQMGLYRAGITDGAMLAIEHDTALLRGYSVLGNTALKTIRKTAVDAFYRGRLMSTRGLSLSHLIWNYAEQAKSEFEVAMSNIIAGGLKEGTSAEELGRMVRGELKHPDMMYRRYHEKVVMSNGKKKDVAIWRRRVIGEDGKIHFVKEPLEKVGSGHYRSARKNALRLMRTEINASYHNANYERWQQEPFVIGVRIFLSPQHPKEDECDLLAGNYPKDFYWTGWHPQCMCAIAPITLQGEEKKAYYRRVALGEDMSDYVSPNAVTDVPQGYKDYVKDHAEKILDADKRGKLAWHFEDNRQYWEDIAKLAVENARQSAAQGTPLTLEHLQEKIDEWINRYSSSLDRYTDKEKQQLLDDIKKVIDESDFGMCVPRTNSKGEDVISAIFDTYFKNQIETGTGKGMVDIDVRKRISNYIFGTDVQKAAPVDFEKYGMLMSRDILKQAEDRNQYWNFGDGIQVRFKKDKVNATFTVGDSLNNSFSCVPAPVSAPSLSAFPYSQLSTYVADANLYARMGESPTLRTFSSNAGYVEVQYHGKLTLDCIESVYIPQQTLRQLKPGTFDKIKKVGCTIYTTDADGKLITL